MDRERDARQKLRELIREQRFAMLATHHGGGALRSRPMTTVERADDESLWFFASGASEVAREVQREAQVCLSYGDSAAHFVSVAGRARVVADATRKRELWGPAVQAWFPQGPEAADVVLIEVTPEHAEYWDSSSNKLVQLFSLAEALASGARPRGLGEHREVDVRNHRPS